MHGEVGLLDDQTGPDPIEQFALADDPVAVLQQADQQVEGAGAQGRQTASDEHTTLVGLDLNVGKPQALHAAGVTRPQAAVSQRHRRQHNAPDCCGACLGEGALSCT